MIRQIASAALSLTMMTAASTFAQQPAAQSRLRPPSVPLISCDPYFSVWSANDKLTDGPTRHWTGKPQPLTSLVRVDDQTFRVMGDEPKNIEAAKQVGLTVLPTRTLYEFDASGVHLTLTFMTPLLPDDLMVCSRPVTYLTWDAKSTDGKSHAVSVYLDAAAHLAVNVPNQKVVEQRGTAGDLTTLRVGTVEQPVLEETGDDQRIDWGYFYLAGNTKQSSICTAAEGRDAFAKGTALAAEKSAPTDGVAAKEAPVIAMAFDLGKVSANVASAHALLAYDDLFSIRYFNTDLKAYWTKDGAKIDDLLQNAEKELPSLVKRCDTFDNELVADMQKIGGDSYVQLGVLSWRQALAAQKICADANGQPLMFSKENFSNGCISTVDVLYPAAPQMIAFAPNMLKASLVPLMDYSASPRWRYQSAPHDLGQYPHATGQVYGGEGPDAPMPVEECGNLLVLHAALAKATGSAEFSKKYWPTLTKWVKYLEDKGLDPANQLCTDDFAGHIARNANLSAKAIMGIASYGYLADQLGHKDEAAAAMKLAKDYLAKWQKLGLDPEGTHYQLVFGDKGKGTWSQKYNFVWDKLLGFNLLPPEIEQKELAFYKTKLNVFGLPLDSRKEYTKLDWELWTATWATKHEDFMMIVDACAKWVNETPDRAPMGDWYQTINGHKEGFQARSVVGGLFIPFIADETLWKKYASRDKTQPSNWAAGDFAEPQKHVLVPAADNEPSNWKYTFDKPSDDKWFESGFDDSKWKSGRSGFGTRHTPGARVNTKWDSDDIWIRRDVLLPNFDPKTIRLLIHHDDDADVYINGVLALHAPGAVNDYGPRRISAEAIATLKKDAKNTIAVHCHQTGGGQFIDVGFIEIVRPAKK